MTHNVARMAPRALHTNGGTSPPTSRLAQRINDQRRLRGVSDATTAKELGVDQSTFNRWRTGRTIPPDDHAPAIADWLGVPPETVYAWMEDARRARPRRERPRGYDTRLRELESTIAELRAAVVALELRLTPTDGRSVRSARR